MTSFDYSFGRKTPSDDKFLLHSTTWSFKQARSRFGLSVPLSIEKTLAIPDYRTYYDQGQIGGCTGWSASWEMSIYNNKKYNAYKLYKRGQQTDGDPGTSGDNDGGYIWAVHDVLKNEGHWAVDAVGNTLPVSLEEGIESYYWIQTTADLRSAFDAGRPVVFGINWYEEFMTPKLVNNEYWIGTKSKWGAIMGGHAIAAYAISDTRQAVRLINSWGTGYPDVWISYKSIQTLLSQRGECVASFDRVYIPPEPEPEDIMEVTAMYNGKTYKGTLKSEV